MVRGDRKENEMRKVVFVSLALLAFTPAAMADLSNVGDVMPSDSWGQRFQENGVGNYDLMAIRWVSGNTFEATTALDAFRNFSVAGWNSVVDSPTMASVTGPAKVDSQFDIYFNGSSSSPLAFDFFAFDGTALKEAVHATWNGGWGFQVFTEAAMGTVTRSTFTSPGGGTVPAPGAALLIGVGLSLVGWLKRRIA